MARVHLRATALGASLAALTCAAANAQGTDGEEPVEHIVVTGTAVEAAAGETLQSVDVLRLDEVIEKFDGSLGASLAKLPGISTSSFGPAVGRPIIRGLGGYRVRILNNGIGLVDASSLSADHAATAEVLDAEQVDILRGPAAVAYGGGAVGGVINIVDGRIPTRPLADMVDGQAYLGYTSVDDGAQIAARARTGGGPFIVQLEGSHREAGDFDIPGFARSERLRALDPSSDPEPRDTVANSGYDFESYGGGASVTGDWGFFGVSVRDYDAEYGLPAEAPGPDAVVNPHIEMEQTRIDLRGEIALGFGPFDHIDLSGGHADYQHAEIEDSGEVGTLFANDGWEARAALVNGSRRTTWSGSLGVSARDSDFSALGEEAFVPPVKTQDSGAFVAQRYDRGGWGLEGGLRIERRELDPESAPSRSFDTVSGAVGGFLRPGDGVFLSASLTRTERAPEDQELYSNGPHAATETFEIGDPTLGKETGLSLDLIARITRDRWSVNAGAFYSDFSDFIYLAPTDDIDPDEGLPIFRFLQDDATLWGGEISAGRDIADIGPWTLSADAGLEYVRGETKTFGDLPQMPPFSAIFGANLERDVVDLRAEVEAVAEQNKAASFELPTDGYTFVNLSATARPFGDTARIVFELKNLTDEEGRLHTSQLKDVVPLPGRSFRIGVLTTF